MTKQLGLTRRQILAFRRHVGALDERLPNGRESLRHAAWAGAQDSMPRAALLSLHARVDGIKPATLEDPSLAQLWGPRFSTYLVAKRDFALFSLGRLPEDARGRERAERMAARLHGVLDGRRMTEREAGAAAGINPNAFKYGASTGTIALRWDGARSPEVWTVAAPSILPTTARRELARRYLHVFGPATADGFAKWAGIGPPVARAAFASLEGALVSVRTPHGDAWLLDEDESAARAGDARRTTVRLLPSGDAYFLLAGAERRLLVPRADQRARLWTPRVWPGAVLVDGEIRGTWRRSAHTVAIDAWSRLPRAVRERVEAEARSLPLPGEREIAVVWTG